VPKRFVVRALYEENFVVAAQARHPFLENPSLERFLEARHLLVSETGDAAGIVDAALANRGLSRRIGVTVPSFALALALVAETDLLCALPRALIARNGARLGVAAAEAPLELPRYRISAIAPSGVAADAGLAWFIEALTASVAPEDA
jgi:DNA-binding transcriptional LysR family regulator